jgi:hypothetical protein
MTPLSDAISMPPLTVFDVIGIGTNKPRADTKAKHRRGSYGPIASALSGLLGM